MPSRLLCGIVLLLAAMPAIAAEEAASACIGGLECKAEAACKERDEFLGHTGSNDGNVDRGDKRVKNCPQRSLKSDFRKRFADFIGAADRKTAVSVLAANALECAVLKASALQKLRLDGEGMPRAQFDELPKDDGLARDLASTMHAVEQIAYLDQRTGSDVPAQLRQTYAGLPSAFDYLLTYAQAEEHRVSLADAKAQESRDPRGAWIGEVAVAYDALSTSSSCQFRLPTKEERASRMLSATIPMGGKLELGFLGDVRADLLGPADGSDVQSANSETPGQTRLTFSASSEPRTSTWLLRNIDNGRTQSLKITTAQPKFCSSLKVPPTKSKAVLAAFKLVADYCSPPPYRSHGTE
ncbi:MAG: hypothetical protein ABIQ70_03525 [Dokdonella sp.]